MLFDFSCPTCRRSWKFDTNLPAPTCVNYSAPTKKHTQHTQTEIQIKIEKHREKKSRSHLIFSPMSRIHKLSRSGHGLIHVVHHLVAIETNARKRGQKMLHCSHSKLKYTRMYEASYYIFLFCKISQWKFWAWPQTNATGTCSADSQWKDSNISSGSTAKR